MDIKRVGTRPADAGPADYFTGAVRVEPLNDAEPPARQRCAMVTFEPKARTAWHTHPLGQTLLIVSGVCRVQSWGGAVEELNTGDVVWFAPGEKHWHGAGPDASMTHVAVQEALNGSAAEWLEQVSEEEYSA